jgi:tRNA modification GTPase
VVIAGPPNVGKSSLVNALAGYQRSVVSEVAGTTRDTVSVRTAFDGWPVELIDTAGLRDAGGLEGEGIDRAKRVLSEADLVVWVMDASSRDEVYPDDETLAAVKLPLATGWILVMNKSDRSLGWQPNYPPGAIHLSAKTGENIARLAEWIAYRLVPDPPTPNSAVPFTPQLTALIEAAGNASDPASLLREALAIAESHHVG